MVNFFIEYYMDSHHEANLCIRMLLICASYVRNLEESEEWGSHILCKMKNEHFATFINNLELAVSHIIL